MAVERRGANHRGRLMIHGIAKILVMTGIMLLAAICARGG